MLLIPFLEATAEYQRLKAFRQGEITMISLEESMAKDVARFFRHQGSVLLEYLPEEFDEQDFSRAWDRTQLETYLEFRDLLLKHKRRAAYTCLRALENELSVPLEEAAKPRTIGTKISFDDFDEEAYKHIEQYAGARISQIDDTTKKDIREIIAKGFKGELQPDGTTKYKTHQQIAKDIKDKFKEFGDPVKGPSHIRNRAHLVAVTELREAGETSKQLARNRMEERGWQMLKRWMNMGDDRVSDGCIENGNAGWIDNREAFPSGHQFPPRFPGCRCGAGSKVGDRKEKSGLPDDRWIVTRQGDKVVVKPNPKYANGYDNIIPNKSDKLSTELSKNDDLKFSANLNDLLPASSDPGIMRVMRNSSTPGVSFRVSTSSTEKFAYGWADYNKEGDLLKYGGGATDEQLMAWNAKAKLGANRCKENGVDISEDIYIRYGRIPKDGKSKNYATGEYEKGTSAYIGEYVPETNSFKIGEGSGLDGNSLLLELGGKTPYLIRGVKIGIGSDGEPLLKDAELIGTLKRWADGNLRLKRH